MTRKLRPSVLALLAVLLACFAAPYLVPEDPDSPVFRSGALRFCLMLACFLPLKEAFEKSDHRVLRLSLILGLLLGTALGLGSELRFYQGLLPGTGSLIRRIAVPLMAAPFLGGLIARLMQCRLSSDRTLSLPFWFYFCLFLICWTPVLLAYFPGMLNYDFLTERGNFQSGYYSHRHPMLYFIVNNGLLSLGTLIHSANLGLLFSSLWHMASLSFALAYACCFLQRHRVPRFAILFMTAYFAFHPMFSVMSVSQSKDTLFAATLTVLSLLAWDLLENPEAFFSSRKQCALFLLMTVLTAHMRKNGMVALFLLFPLLLVALRAHFASIARLIAKACAAALAVLLVLEAAFPWEGQPYFQFLSVPAQQLVRAYRLGDLSEEDREEIASWYYSREGLRLIPQLADGAKGYLMEERLEPELGEYLSLWLRIGKKCPRVYLEAFLLLNLGSWYPDDRTHASIYANTGADRKGYLELNEYRYKGYEPHSLLPAVREFYESLCREHSYFKVPIIPLLFSIATPFWLLLYACFSLLAQRRKRMILPASGVLAIFVSYLLGPCALPRYSLQLFTLAPVFFLLSFMTSTNRLRTPS